MDVEVQPGWSCPYSPANHYGMKVFLPSRVTRIERMKRIRRIRPGLLAGRRLGGGEELIGGNGWETDLTDRTPRRLLDGPLYPFPIRRAAISNQPFISPNIQDFSYPYDPLHPFHPCNSSEVETLIPC
jgi:hypothetical protein